MRSFAVIGWIFATGLASSSAVADLLILKGGQRIEGKVEEQGGSYVVQTPHGTLTVPRVEVEKKVSDVEVLASNAEVLRVKAKALCDAAVAAQADPKISADKLQEAFKFYDQAVDLYTEAREIYTGDRYSHLDAAAFAVIQEKRNIRERFFATPGRASSLSPSADGSSGNPPVAEAVANGALDPKSPSPGQSAVIWMDKTKVEEMTRKATSGDAESQYLLGMHFQLAARDYGNAMKWYKAAADQKHAEATGRIGVMYKFGQGVKHSYPEALTSFRKAHLLGDPYAAQNIGSMYLFGFGCKKNLRMADEWAEKSIPKLRVLAEAGDPRAQSAMGWLSQEGLGIQRDEKQAVLWFRKSIQQGLSISLNSLGVMYSKGAGGLPKDIDEAQNCYRKAAETGDVTAMMNLGGYAEWRHEYAEAVKWYKKSADHGEFRAYAKLAVLYYDGRGVAKDFAEAMKLYRKGADLGDDSAQYSVGYMFKNGEGVSKNLKEAAKWLKMSVENGNDNAIVTLGTIYHEMANYSEAAKCYLKAAKLGNAYAEANIGILYEDGLGVRKNVSEARRWYLAAAQKGIEGAKEALVRLGAK